jgi:hypothetical protein
MYGTFSITATTVGYIIFVSQEPSLNSFFVQPVPDVVAYFTEAEGLPNYTSQIEQATEISLYPELGDVADVYFATLADGTKVGIKCLRNLSSGRSIKNLKVCFSTDI